jgi:hypothetical protein
MKSLRLIWLILLSGMILAAGACKKYYPQEGDDNNHLTEDSGDYIWDLTDEVNIVLTGASATVEGEGATVNGSQVTVTAGGNYRISGTLENGRLVVDNSDDVTVRLILGGVDITNSKSAAIFVRNAAKVVVIMPDGTENRLTDGTSYVFDDLTDEEPAAALYSKSYLSFFGTGSLNVNGRFRDGIVGKDGLVINSGIITVNAVDDGIRGKDFIVVWDGEITISSGGDGLKSDQDNDESLGFIMIENGDFKIAATAGDAIDATTSLTIADGDFYITTGTVTTKSAGTVTGGFPGGVPGGSSGGYSGLISEKGLKAGGNLSILKGSFEINTADDAIHSGNQITIEDGSVSAASGDDGVHSDGAFVMNGGTLNITKSYEGIEGPSITVNGGDISLVSDDDGFNATKGSATEANDGSILYFNGGSIAVNSSKGDGLDSNGNITMKAGTVVVHGPQSSPEVGFDVNGTFAVSGGFLIATGPNSGNMIEVPSSSSSQYSVKVTFSSSLSSSTLFHIQDADGNDCATFKPVRSVYYIVVSSPDFKNGSTYSIYTGGTYTGTESNGLYTGGIYSGGTLRKSFTITSKNTSISI